MTPDQLKRIEAMLADTDGYVIVPREPTEEMLEPVRALCEENKRLREALCDFSKIAAQAKPNCGPKLRELIQNSQVKHREALKNV